MSSGRWRAVAYTPRSTNPCVGCGKRTCHRDQVCNLCAWRESVERENAMTDEPTDRDVITGHPFQPHPLQAEVCGFQHGDGFACGFPRSEHADQGEPAP
jgi:hypothetical protein